MSLYKIMLVDDEEEVRKSIIKKIDWADAGFEVVGDAENGEEALEKEIIAFLKKNGGKVDNLSLVLDHLKKKHPQFNVSDYGYNRVSSFLRSFDKISVHGNALMLKEG